MDPAQKKSSLHIVSGVFFSLFFLLLLTSSILSLITSISAFHRNEEVYHTFWNMYGMTLINNLLQLFGALLLAFSAFFARNRVMPVIGFGFNFLIHGYFIVRGVFSMFMMLDYASSASDTVRAITYALNYYFIAMAAGLVFSVFMLTRRYEQPLKTWFIPGLVSVGFSTLFFIVRIVQIILEAIEYGGSILLAELLSLLGSLLGLAFFYVGFFLLTKYLSLPQQSAAPAYAVPDGYSEPYQNIAANNMYTNGEYAAEQASAPFAEQADDSGNAWE